MAMRGRDVRREVSSGSCRFFSLSGRRCNGKYSPAETFSVGSQPRTMETEQTCFTGNCKHAVPRDVTQHFRQYLATGSAIVLRVSRDSILSLATIGCTSKYCKYTPLSLHPYKATSVLAKLNMFAENIITDLQTYKLLQQDAL